MLTSPEGVDTRPAAATRQPAPIGSLPDRDVTCFADAPQHGSLSSPYRGGGVPLPASRPDRSSPSTPAQVHLAVASADHPGDGGRVHRLDLHRPLLSQAGHYHGALISMALLVFGVASVAGSTLGGQAHRPLRCASRGCRRSRGAHPGDAGGQRRHRSVGRLASTPRPRRMGLGGWTFPPSQQHRLVATAPDDASVVLGLNSSAIYAGAAIGDVVGGLVLPAGAAFVPALAACAFICVAAQHHYAPPRRDIPPGPKPSGKSWTAPPAHRLAHVDAVPAPHVETA